MKKLPRWWLKAAVQGTMSLLPRPERWNRLLQKYVTRSVYLTPARFATKWNACQRHLDVYRSLRGGVPTVALELGTGWHPIIPVGLALLGVPQVYTIDVRGLVTTRTLEETLRFFEAEVKLCDARRGTAEASDAFARAKSLIHESPTAALDALGVSRLIGDARRTQLRSQSVDLFVSNNTLEHIPRGSIADIFREFRRLASPAAAMSHYIDMADHYAGYDRSITVYNFLKFSERQWRPLNNSLQYQNRLRVTDFRELHDETGWQVAAEDNSSDPEAFGRIKPAPEFRSYSAQDCMVFGSWMVANPLEA